MQDPKLCSCTCRTKRSWQVLGFWHTGNETSIRLYKGHKRETEILLNTTSSTLVHSVTISLNGWKIMTACKINMQSQLYWITDHPHTPTPINCKHMQHIVFLLYTIWHRSVWRFPTAHSQQDKHFITSHIKWQSGQIPCSCTSINTQSQWSIIWY